MKKTILAMSMVVLSSSLVMARPMGHHPGGQHRPPTKHQVIHHKPHHKGGSFVGGFVAGVIGSVIGNYFISNQYRAPDYVVASQPDNTQVIRHVDNIIITSSNHF